MGSTESHRCPYGDLFCRGECKGEVRDQHRTHYFDNILCEAVKTMNIERCKYF